MCPKNLLWSITQPLLVLVTSICHSLYLHCYIVLVVFNILPALLLVLYPIRAFRVYLSKCRMDRLAVTIFVEKFQGCYRDGVIGGRDMRCFSGLYFFLRFFVLLRDLLCLKKLHITFWTYQTYLFLTTTLLIAYLKPYKQNYMNVLDTLLLAHITAVCQLLSTDHFPTNGNIIVFYVLLLPAIVFGLLLVINVCYKVKKKAVEYYTLHWRTRCLPEVGNSVLEQSNDQRQPLVMQSPTSVIIDVKSYNSTD